MVYLVGAGPGDPGLVTVKALEVIRRADVVLYDRLAAGTLLAETKPGCVLVDVGKSSGRHTMSQDEIVSLLIEYGGRGLEVVRLKGGDPFLFGRGAEEAERLHRAGIPFVVVPGVSALNAASAYAGIPLTHRDHASSLGVATGHGAGGKRDDPVRWTELVGAVDTLVVFMGVGRIETITERLSRGRLAPDTPAAVIERGATPLQRVITGNLATIAEDARRAGIEPPALLVVGSTVELRDELEWFTPGPLAGLKVALTRPLRQSGPLAARLTAFGAQPFLMPTIRTVDAIDTEEVESAVRSVSRYDYVVFSSVNGVESFFRALNVYGWDVRALGGVGVACIGPVTAGALRRFGVTADVVAERYVAEGMLDALRESGRVSGRRFLLVRSDKGRSTLAEGLADSGAEVHQVPFYGTEMEELRPHDIETIRGGGVDVVTFTSSSTVHFFFGQVPSEDVPESVRLASIGPQTSRAIRKYGREPDIEADIYTTEGLVDAVMRHYGKSE